MKETFSFIIFLPFFYMVAKYLLRKNKNLKLFIKCFTLSLSGILIVLFINYTYLSVLGILKNYSEISVFKSQLLFNSFSSFLHEFLVKLNPFNFIDFSVSFYKVLYTYYMQPFILSYFIFFILFIISVCYPKVNTIENSYSRWSPKIINKEKIKISFNHQWNESQGIAILIFGLLLLNFEGFRILNKFGPNYVLQLAPSILLAFALLYNEFYSLMVKLTKRKIKGNPKRNLIIISILGSFLFLNFLLPNNNLFRSFRFMSIQKYINGMLLKKPKIIIPDKVKLRMGNDNRIFSAYGWGTPSFYYFSHTKPFSRYFIKNIIKQQQCKDLVNQFKHELPKVIIYTNILTDMDVNKFEMNVINLKKILQKCYKFYPDKSLEFMHYKGYWLLANPDYFKNHMSEFISNKYLY